MEFLPRDQIINELKQAFPSYIDNFGIDAIGIFEEEGQDDTYHLGYTVTKQGKTYHIHTPYIKNNTGDLAALKDEWTVETDDPEQNDQRGYSDLESVFREI